MVKEKSIAIIARKGFHSSQFFISEMQFLGTGRVGPPFCIYFSQNIEMVAMQQRDTCGFIYIYYSRTSGKKARLLFEIRHFIPLMVV